MAGAVALLTAEQAADLGQEGRWELIDGAIVDMPPVGPLHGREVIKLGSRLLAHVEAAGLGRVYTEVGFVLRRNPDTVRAPDLAFVRAEQLERHEEPERGFWEIAPDLVVEVLSPDDRPGEVQMKVREWIEAGVRLVWVVDPIAGKVLVVRSLTERFDLSAGDRLEGADVLPGFVCGLDELFR